MMRERPRSAYAVVVEARIHNRYEPAVDPLETMESITEDAERNVDKALDTPDTGVPEQLDAEVTTNA